MMQWRLSTGLRGWFAAGCVLLAAPFSPAAAQGLGKLDRERVHIMLEQIRAEVQRRYYDSTFKGIDLAARYQRADARIREATTLADALAAVAQFTLDLHDSHTFFVPPRQTVRADYGWTMAMVGDSCYIVRVTPRSDAARQGVVAGDLVVSVNAYRPTRENLWQLLYLYHVLRPQRALHVVLKSPGAVPRPLDLAAEAHEGKLILDLTGADGGTDIARLIWDADKVERELRPRVVEYGRDVLIWKLPTFGVEEQLIRDIVKRARDRKTLILDLRGNSGGPSRSLLTLVGRLNSGDVVLGMLRERRDTVPFIVKGAGTNAFSGQVLVLVDSRSASASEILARAVQIGKRGTVLGDRTAGAVMTGRYKEFTIGTESIVVYGVSVTVADLIMSDGGRLEGQGVTPDVLLLPTASDLATERDPVLAHALSLAGSPTSAAEAGTLLKDK